jgi:hypothetical protein
MATFGLLWLGLYALGMASTGSRWEERFELQTSRLELPS